MCPKILDPIQMTRILREVNNLQGPSKGWGGVWSAHLHELVEGELAAVVLVKHPEQGLCHHTRLQHHRHIIYL